MSQRCLLSGVSRFDLKAFVIPVVDTNEICIVVQFAVKGYSYFEFLLLSVKWVTTG